eukprot:scaffold69164_cov15-Tisochrysis_lutea.AAC.1
MQRSRQGCSAGEAGKGEAGKDAVQVREGKGKTQTCAAFSYTSGGAAQIHEGHDNKSAPQRATPCVPFSQAFFFLIDNKKQMPSAMCVQDGMAFVVDGCPDLKHAVRQEHVRHLLPVNSPSNAL